MPCIASARDCRVRIKFLRSMSSRRRLFSWPMPSLSSLCVRSCSERRARRLRTVPLRELRPPEAFERRVLVFGRLRASQPGAHRCFFCGKRVPQRRLVALDPPQLHAGAGGRFPHPHNRRIDVRLVVLDLSEHPVDPARHRHRPALHSIHGQPPVPGRAGGVPGRED